MSACCKTIECELSLHKIKGLFYASVTTFWAIDGFIPNECSIIESSFISSIKK